MPHHPRTPSAPILPPTSLAERLRHSPPTWLVRALEELAGDAANLAEPDRCPIAQTAIRIHAMYGRGVGESPNSNPTQEA